MERVRPRAKLTWNGLLRKENKQVGREESRWCAMGAGRRRRQEHSATCKTVWEGMTSMSRTAMTAPGVDIAAVVID